MQFHWLVILIKGPREALLKVLCMQAGTTTGACSAAAATSGST